MLDFIVHSPNRACRDLRPCKEVPGELLFQAGILFFMQEDSYLEKKWQANYNEMKQYYKRLGIEEIPEGWFPALLDEFIGMKIRGELDDR